MTRRRGIVTVVAHRGIPFGRTAIHDRFGTVTIPVTVRVDVLRPDGQALVGHAVAVVVGVVAALARVGMDRGVVFGAVAGLARIARGHAAVALLSVLDGA